MPRRGNLVRAAGKVREVGRLVDRVLAGEQAGGQAKEQENAEAEMAALARRLLLGQALEAAAALSLEDVAGLSPEKLVQMVVRLEQTRIAAGRLRLQETRGKDKAREEIIAQLEEELPDRPDLLAGLVALLDGALAGEEAAGAPQAVSGE